MVSNLQLYVGPQLDSRQFALKHQRGTDDATNSTVPKVTKHLENPRANHNQKVRLNTTPFEPLTLSTGAPQGCVSSTVLFTLFTNECACTTPNNDLITCTDDTAILGLTSDTTDTAVSKPVIQNFVLWSDKQELNIKKTDAPNPLTRSSQIEPVFGHR